MKRNRRNQEAVRGLLSLLPIVACCGSGTPGAATVSMTALCSATAATDSSSLISAQVAAPVVAPRVVAADVAPVVHVRSAREYFETLPLRFQPSAARGVHAVVEFELTGSECATWHVVIDDGKMKLHHGPAANANATIRMRGDEYLKVVNGEWNGAAAVMRGAMKVSGDLVLAQKLSGMFPPGAVLQKSSEPELR